MAPLIRPARDAAGALLAGAARATGRGVRAEHLSVLDGRTLNLAAVVSGAPSDGPAAVEFASGQHWTNAAARTVPTAEGRTRVEATIRLRAGDAYGSPESAGFLPEVVLTSGVWNIQLLVGGGGQERRMPLAAPGPGTAGNGAPTPHAAAGRDARFSVTSTLSGTAALAVRAPGAAAYVRAVLVRPHLAQVTGELVGAGAPEETAAEVVQWHGSAVYPVRPLLSPGHRGTAFTVALPLPAMADSAASSGASGARWELRFHTADGACLRARREMPGVAAPRPPVRLPPQTVRPGSGPPVLLCPFYASSAALVIGLTALPRGA